ncbi:MAG: GIY-YIG nuclease family protein [Thermoplasmata archaeon]|nr:MAG: GIY-YIG nuclease family protein [Thermoplasmata archaeon]
MKGSYVLLVLIPRYLEIQIGKKFRYNFKKGYYAYVGSALNGLEQRINRHLSSNKKYHWHIDYLLDYGHITDIFYMKSNRREECNIASIFASSLQGIKGFGCSDCKCYSHLFYGSRDEILSILKKLDMKRFL